MFAKSRLLICALVVAASSAPAAPTLGDDRARQAQFDEQIRPFLTTYCYDCHSGEAAEGELRLDTFAKASEISTTGRKTWLKVHGKLLGRAMPPEDAEQPSDEERETVVRWLETAVDDYDCTGPIDPGHETIRRLTRYEYKNTIRDLLGVEAELADDFPLDDVGYGFDNIGDVLTLSPVLLEKYLAAAEAIAPQAVAADLRRSLPGRRLDAEQMQAGRVGNLPGGWRKLATSDRFRGSIDVPADGEYLVRTRAYADQAGDEPAKMRVSVDEQDKLFDVAVEEDQPSDFQFRARLRGGERPVSIAFTNDYYEPNNPNPRRRDRNLAVHHLEIVGPFGLDSEDYRRRHARIFIVSPDEQDGQVSATRAILQHLATRAFRRRVSDSELARLVALAKIGKERSGRPAGGIELALQAILVSPHFLFKVERDPAADDADGIVELNDYELATRLSYFLWSSMPDEELFSLAARGELKPNLEAQTRRMLADDKAQAVVENFAPQWLQLRSLPEMEPDRRRFRSFSDELRRDMLAETKLFFAAVMREDRSLLELIDADFTYLNERLARHYGIGQVQGGEFQRVDVRRSPRGGLLTQASVLTVTSNPTRTSPVKRGKWIMETILGTPPPDPPADVPDLEETAKVNPKLSLREQLEIHRRNPRCASCHRQMDALGLALENFDAVGAWRDRERNAPIDASGELPGGEKFAGPAELKKLLVASQKDDFLRCVTEKMLTYALGRGVEYYDRCTVDEIVAALAKDDYKFSRLVVEIVRSEAFQKRRGN